jgi:putative peptidoglycan lipid II flippase
MERYSPGRQIFYHRDSYQRVWVLSGKWFSLLFGSSRSTDAFNAAFRIPNLLRDCLLRPHFQPPLCRLTEEKSKSRPEKIFWPSELFTTLLLVVGAVTILGLIFSRPLASLVAMGFNQIPEKLSLTANLTFITFPFLLFVSLAAGP